jgi:hypothetical protein
VTKSGTCNSISQGFLTHISVAYFRRPEKEANVCNAADCRRLFFHLQGEPMPSSVEVEQCREENLSFMGQLEERTVKTGEQLYPECVEYFNEYSKPILNKSNLWRHCHV